MSITAYKIESVGHDRTGKDYGYVNIMYRYGNKQSCPRPDQCEKMEVMWADESVYGPPAPGSKVGDFIKTWLMGSWDCGVFTHREIAQRLMDTFTGLKFKELAWFENPREKTLKNGKPRARRAKWLPDREVDLVYLYSDYYIDAREPTSAQTDFFTVTRMDAWGVSTWFMCTPQATEKLLAMDYDNLAVKTDAATERFHTLAGDIQQTEAELSRVSDLMAAVVQYAKTRPAFDGYKAAKYSRKYLAEHEAELADYRAAKATMAELLGGEKLPKMDVLKEKRRQLAARKKALYLEYRKAQQDMRELVAVKGSVDHLRGLTDNQRNKEQAR